MRTILILLLASILAARAAAQSQPQSAAQPPSQSSASQNQISVVPLPAQFQPGAGQLLIDGSFTVATEGAKDDRIARAVVRFMTNLSHETGIPFHASVNNSKAVLTLHAEHASKHVQEFAEDESYTLDVTASGARLAAPNTLGILHGLETFLQLVQVTPTGFAAPAVHIEDKPRFPWRGLMIDVSRHFSPVDVIKRNIDGMAAVKLNVLHWHLSDNQGFRVESKAFPKLEEMGSDGNYYTQAEIREVIEYAADRGIRVVPEFDIPGHATSWFVGYPQLSSGPGPYSIERDWGVFDPAMDPTRDETYKFLDKFIGEMSESVSGSVLSYRRRRSERQAMGRKSKDSSVHARASDQKQSGASAILHGSGPENRRQASQTDDRVGRNSQSGMPNEIVIQSWRGQSSLAAAAKQGYRGLLSNGYYLDAMWTAAHHYSVDPLSGDAANLSADEKSRILGGEACAWAEYITPANIDSRLWPRTAAIAERLWSPAETLDVDSMYRRLSALNWRLEWLGIRQKANYSAMLGRMVDTDDVAPLRVLGDAVRPSDLGTREQTAERAGTPLSSATPLNRMVDAVPPESEAANDFTRAVNVLVASNFKDADTETQVRVQLERWRDNPARLQPLLDSSSLLKELTPVSQSLASLGAAGLQALDYLDKGERAPDAWKTQTLAMIDQASQPHADLFIAVAPAIQTLVNASAGTASPQPASK